ncbi:MAG: methyltransferase [Candidatus Parcubacteria bacterium]|nr:MAG: methyltransferase [Candidatus Parcubacteria bacterium]
MGSKNFHKIIIGDSRKMQEIEDNTVHLIVTSPPYWQLKDYGDPRQIGFHNSYEEYINNLNLVWKECFRVLHPGCRMCINIGDQFARSVYYGRYKIIPIRTEIIKFCETIGFDYMGAIIWQKKTTMNTTGGATVMGSYPYPRNGIIEIDYEFILIFKKPGEPPKVNKEIKEEAKLTKEEWKEYFSGHWYFNGERQKGHIAMFPVELPKRLIKMFTFPGEIVVDPFLGSGTTTLAAISLQRSSIGYEINRKFLPIIKRKICYDKYSDIIDIIEQKLTNFNVDEEIKKLPYIFIDPKNLDKKVDPHKLNFGSKVSINDIKKVKNYLRVKEVLSPTELLLSNNLKIKLIGVKPIKEKEKEAIQFLRKKILNQPIFLKFDREKYTEDGILLAYVYLKNKTFINANLIKNNLVEIDTSIDFRYKNLFYKYYKPKYYKHFDYTLTYNHEN